MAHPPWCGTPPAGPWWSGARGGGGRNWGGGCVRAACAARRRRLRRAKAAALGRGRSCCCRRLRSGDAAAAGAPPTTKRANWGRRAALLDCTHTLPHPPGRPPHGGTRVAEAATTNGATADVPAPVVKIDNEARAGCRRCLAVHPYRLACRTQPRPSPPPAPHLPLPLTSPCPSPPPAPSLPPACWVLQSDPFATIVSVEFGDRLGELLDTVSDRAAGVGGGGGGGVARVCSRGVRSAGLEA